MWVLALKMNDILTDRLPSNEVRYKLYYFVRSILTDPHLVQSNDEIMFDNDETFSNDYLLPLPSYLGLSIWQ